MKNTKQNLLIAALLILFGVAMRFIDHPVNFAPIAAIALFSAVYLPKKIALFVPIIAMLLSDLFLGFYEWQVMFAVYGSFLIAGAFGFYIRKNKKIGTVIAGSLFASIIFFVLTNLAIWLFSGYYEHTMTGLLYCYTLAVPFFRNTMLGDLFFVGVLFGSYEFVCLAVKNKFREKVLRTS